MYTCTLHTDFKLIKNKVNVISVFFFIYKIDQVCICLWHKVELWTKTVSKVLVKDQHFTNKLIKYVKTPSAMY